MTHHNSLIQRLRQRGRANLAISALSALLAVSAVPAFGSANCPVDMPDEMQELHRWPAEFVIEWGGSLDDFTPPVMTIDGMDAAEVLPPGTCSIRFRRIAGWHWGNPGPINMQFNGDTDVLEDFDFVVWGLGLPGCNGPTTYVTPVTGNGHWLNGASQLVVQTDVAPCDNIELMNTDGLPYHEWPHMSEPAEEPDICDTFPVLCYGWDNPCIGHVIDPELCEESGSVFSKGWSSKAPIDSILAKLDLLAILLDDPAGSTEIDDVLDVVASRAATAEAESQELRDAHDQLTTYLDRHPEHANGLTALRLRTAMATSLDLTDKLMDRCTEAISELERAQVTGGLTAEAAADTRDRCRAAAHNLERVSESAGHLWSAGLADATTTTTTLPQ